MELSLKQAADLALAPDGNARVKLASELIRQSQIRANQARAALLPNLDAAVSEQNFTRSLKAFGVKSPSPLISFPEIAGPLGVFDARATATQTIFDFTIVKRLAAAKENIELAKAEQESVSNQVTDLAARAYMQALRADAQVGVAKSNIELAEAIVKLARSQKDAGAGTGIEVTRAQLQAATERQRLLSAENDRDRAHLQLLRAIGLPLATKLTLTGKLDYTPPDAVSAEDAVKTAATLRADLKTQSRRETVAKLNYSAARAERLPTIGAFADAGGIGLEVNDLRFTRTFGVQLKMPLFDGGRRAERRAESESLMRQEKIRTEDLHRQIELEVRQALDNLQSADGQVKVAAEALNLSESELAQARRRYEAGVGTSIEVTDAQTRLARARDNQTAALFFHNIAKIDLASAMGAIHKVIQ